MDKRAKKIMSSEFRLRRIKLEGPVGLVMLLQKSRRTEKSQSNQKSKSNMLMQRINRKVVDEKIILSLPLFGKTKIVKLPTIVENEAELEFSAAENYYCKNEHHPAGGCCCGNDVIRTQNNKQLKQAHRRREQSNSDAQTATKESCCSFVSFARLWFGQDRRKIRRIQSNDHINNSSQDLNSDDDCSTTHDDV